MISRRVAISVLVAGMAGSLMSPAHSAGLARPGVNYTLVANPQAPVVASGKVEVAEFFWYGCGHCYALDPVLEEWNHRKPDHIQFVRVPVVWAPVHRQHAKLFYTLQALQRPELHAQVFDAIHKQGLALSGNDEVKVRAQHAAFLSLFGVDQAKFDAAYDSMMVTMNVQRAARATQALAIENVPTLIIQGKYATSASQAGGESQLLALIEELAAGERR